MSYQKKRQKLFKIFDKLLKITSKNHQNLSIFIDIPAITYYNKKVRKNYEISFWICWLKSFLKIKSNWHILSIRRSK